MSDCMLTPVVYNCCISLFNYIVLIHYMLFVDVNEVGWDVALLLQTLPAKLLVRVLIKLK